MRWRPATLRSSSGSCAYWSDLTMTNRKTRTLPHGALNGHVTRRAVLRYLVAHESALVSPRRRHRRWSRAGATTGHAAEDDGAAGALLRGERVHHRRRPRDHERESD